jgi:CheY-like chemotaxis protein
MRQALAMYFTLLGHRARFAPDLASALQAAAEGRFNALLCDLRLPDGDGGEFLRQLEQAGRRPPVAVAMSAWDGSEALAKSQAAGFQGHLVKPFAPEQLERALAQAPIGVRAKQPSR